MFELRSSSDARVRTPRYRSRRILAAEALESRRLLALTQITLADFVTPRVLDFETVDSVQSAPHEFWGYESVDPYFTNFGVSKLRWISFSSSQIENYDDPNGTRALWGGSAGIRVVSAGATDVYGGSAYFLDFAEPQTKFGFSFADYHYSLPVLIDIRDSNNIQLDAIYVNGEENAANFVYVQSDEPFARIVLEGVPRHGFALDNLTLDDPNLPPVANDDTAVLDEDGSVIIDVAANDYDLDQTLDLSSLAVATGPVHGVVTSNGDGTFVYTPDANFNGTDSFTYDISDTFGDHATATVSVTVNSVIDAVVQVGPVGNNAPGKQGLKLSGFVGVSLFSTQQSAGEIDNFDATTLDWRQAVFTVNGAVVTPQQSTRYVDLDNDGDLDLLLIFRGKDLQGALNAEDVDFVLGVEFGGPALGQDLIGSDSIAIRNKRRSR